MIQKEKECFFCRALADEGIITGELPHNGLHRHHIIFGTGNRQLSEKYGLWVWLCPYHHNMGGKESVHRNDTLRRSMERIGQKAFEMHHGSREDFMKIFMKNYLQVPPGGPAGKGEGDV